jgi:long-chain acyl-CoA synthetase
VVSTWVFDVDGCLIDSLTGTSLRPGARTLLDHLRRSGQQVVWWSAGGQDYAYRRAEAVGMLELVDAFYGKDQRGDAGRYLTDHFLIADLSTAMFVDDRPEDLPIGAPFVAVSPYLGANPHDRGLLAAGERAGLSAEDLYR